MRTDWMILIVSSVCLLAALKVIVCVNQFRLWLRRIESIILESMLKDLGGEDD